MKIYIAGKLGEEKTIEDLMEYFRERGHSITFDWTKTPHLKPFKDNREAITRCAISEVEGVKEADRVILISSDRGIGMFVEFGVALGYKIPVTVVTDNPERTGFFYHPLVKILPNVETLKKEFEL